MLSLDKKKTKYDDKDLICGYCMNVFDNDPIEDNEGNYFCSKDCKNDFARERREEFQSGIE